jgi:hypothetical protein
VTTALARWAKHPTVNKRVLAAARRETLSLYRAAAKEQEDALDALRVAARQTQVNMAETLYGAHKYGRDVHREICVPHYNGKFPTPPDPFEFVKDNRGYALWDGQAWVRINAAVMREIGNGHLRVAWSRACQQQEIVERLESQYAVRLRGGQLMRMTDIANGF